MKSPLLTIHSGGWPRDSNAVPTRQKYCTSLGGTLDAGACSLRLPKALVRVKTWLSLGQSLKVGTDSVIPSEDITARTFIQKERNGTAHAVLAAIEGFIDHDGQIIVLYGDTPLLTKNTLGQTD